jgi:hypothetical protein
MKFSATKALLGTAATVCLLAVTGQAAQAGGMWTYSIDSFNDGTEGRIIGDNSTFEYYGMAFRETSDRMFFAFNSNLAFNAENPSENGHAYSHAQDGRINYGDLFLNFSGNNFNTANANRDLYGIRFDATNDSGVSQLGLYSNVSAVSRTSVNAGYGSLNAHTNAVRSYGGTASYGDLAANTSYFQNNQSARTNIGSGTFVSALEFMSDSDFNDLDFGSFGAVGDYTFGFSVARADVERGSFLANFFAECGNDGVALEGESVPEPSLLGGLMLAGMLAGGSTLRRRKNESAA